MRIGVARHFQIPHSRMTWMDGPGFDAWAEWYDTTEVRATEVPAAGNEWQHCYCSDLPRALFTARTIYNGNIEATPLLREVPYTSFLPRRLTFPLAFWLAASRVGWWMGHRAQRETRAQTKRRILEFVRKLKEEHPDRDVLIVTHGFFMQWLEKELVRAGFKGTVPVRPHGGIIHFFEN
jgi:broad specificity phosphatase PhoE